MEAISDTMREKFVGTREHLFTTEKIVEGNQHWHGESYLWALGIDLRIKIKIGNTSLSTE